MTNVVHLVPGKVDRLNLDSRFLKEIPCIQVSPSPSAMPVSSMLLQVRLLNLQNNEIASLAAPPPTVSSPSPTPLALFSNVVYLDLYNNRLSSLKGCEELRKLRVLMIGKNKLTDLSTLHLHITSPALEVLDVHGNLLTTFFSATAVEVAEEMNAVRVFSQLRVLNVAGNRLSNLNGVECLPSLTEFNARRNKIAMLPAAMATRATGLKKCFLSSNLLGANGATDHALHVLSRCKALEELTIDGNHGSLQTQPMSSQARVVLVSSLPQLRLLDGVAVTDDERKSAKLTALEFSGGPLLGELPLEDAGLKEGREAIATPTSAGSSSSTMTPTDTGNSAQRRPSTSVSVPTRSNGPKQRFSTTQVKAPPTAKSEGPTTPTAQPPSQGSAGSAPSQANVATNSAAFSPTACASDSSVGATLTTASPGMRWVVDLSNARQVRQCPCKGACQWLVLDGASTDFIRSAEAESLLAAIFLVLPNASVQTVELNVKEDVSLWDTMLLTWMIVRQKGCPPSLAGVTHSGRPLLPEWALLLRPFITRGAPLRHGEGASPRRKSNAEDVPAQSSTGSLLPPSSSPFNLLPAAFSPLTQHLVWLCEARGSAGARWSTWRPTRSRSNLMSAQGCARELCHAAAQQADVLRSLDDFLVDDVVALRLSMSQQYPLSTPLGSPSACAAKEKGGAAFHQDPQRRALAREHAPLHRPRMECVPADAQSATSERQASTSRGVAVSTGPVHRRVPRSAGSQAAFRHNHAAQRRGQPASSGSGAVQALPPSTSRPQVDDEADEEDEDEEEEEE
jgi:leucine-rich repeat-containing protein 49